jgi:phage terminase large subunit
MFNCGPLYNSLRLSTADIVVLQGGTDSGKTIAAIQLLCTIATTTKAPAIDPIITIVNKSVPDAKKGAYRTFEGIVAMSPQLTKHIIDWNKSDRVITFRNGWVMEFIGAIDEQTAKQGKRQYLFCNEANGIDWPVFWQYAKRTRVRVIIDYNPSEPFWAHDELIDKPLPSMNDLNAQVQLIISDHRHNPFLTEREHAKTENIKDPELHKVYARGKTGKLIGLIFPSWQPCTVQAFKDFDGYGFGALDFGYTNDPTAALHLKADRKRKIGYVHEICYKPGVSMPDVKKLFYGCGFSEDRPVYCEHDFEAIRQLRKTDRDLQQQFGKSVINAIPARKGSGSVNAGILMLNKEWTIYFTDVSEHILFEKKRYIWETDPTTKKPTNVPVDQFNHTTDAVRYGFFTRYGKSLD